MKAESIDLEYCSSWIFQRNEKRDIEVSLAFYRGRCYIRRMRVGGTGPRDPSYEVCIDGRYLPCARDGALIPQAEMPERGEDTPDETRVVSFRWSNELVEAVAKLASRLGRSKSDLVREAIQQYLDRAG
jgi:Ribbon-helix-helix protein, copG family